MVKAEVMDKTLFLAAKGWVLYVAARVTFPMTRMITFILNCKPCVKNMMISSRNLQGYHLRGLMITKSH